MRKIRIIEHVPLDGVIQAPGGRDEDGDHERGGWIVPHSEPAVGDPRELALVSTKATPSGVLMNAYRHVGSLRTGSFADLMMASIGPFLAGEVPKGWFD